LDSNAFFLSYHGKGYTKADIDGMTLDELNRHTTRLHGQLEAERKHQEQIANSMKRKRPH
jgi:hypothetical protein